MNAWDRNAQRRRDQITSGIDLSYNHVLTPTILQHLPAADGESCKRLLDAGCGPGILAARLRSAGWAVTGVDESKTMIEIARADHGDSDGLLFLVAMFDQLPKVFPADTFDAVVCNMSLTGIADPATSLQGVRAVLRPGGALVLTDVHPWFWRVYKGHEEVTYWEPQTLIEPFTISLDPEPLPAQIVVAYRPLEKLCDAIVDAGFAITRLVEPRPDSDVEKQYPAPWRYPRFILVAAEAR
ncbi:MAG: class I SAM-dependent methyltransferase [Dehalococcoidia bacterium]|nr:class I SAM-dependent methyltransferase [Dehalococcoidia bacterium]